MNVLQAIEELQILKDKCAVLNLAIDRLKEDQKDCKNVSSYEIQLLTEIRDEYEVKRKKLQHRLEITPLATTREVK